jgi:glycosyltransferase involved in cell wall biosynthesis
LKIGVCGFGYGLGRTGGVQVYTQSLVAALERHGGAHEYWLLLDEADEAPAASGRVAVTRVAASTSWKHRPRWAQRLWRLMGWSDSYSSAIDALGLDVVHYPATWCDAWTLRTPMVLTFFDMQDEYFPEFFSFGERARRRMVYRRAVSKATRVIAPSTFTARCLIERYGTPPDKIDCVPVGVGPELTPTAAPGEVERLRHRYGLPPDGFLFYPANPWPHKNHERLLRALKRLGGDAPTLVCTGRLANERRSVTAMATNAGLDSRQVMDLGFVDPTDLPALYRAARALVFPSLFEGFGIPVLEAMASGCVVACAHATALPELATDAAKYFDPLDENAIAEAIRAIWHDEELRSQLRERGLRRAGPYRWEHVAPAVSAVYARTKRCAFFGESSF